MYEKTIHPGTSSRLLALLLAIGAGAHACTPDFGPLATGDGASPGGGGAGESPGGGGGTNPQGGTGTGGENQAGTAAGTGPGARGGSGGSEAGSDGGPDGEGGEDAAGAGGGGTVEPIAEVVDVSLVWSGHPVPFAVHTEGDQQFVAYYSTNRQMTVARRTLGQSEWQIVLLPSTCSWDSHEWIRLALDEQQYVHVVGNMHDDPLTYFRTTSPLDVGTFQQLTSMVGTNESRCTYPELFHNAQGNLVFTYRDGSSGDGSTFVNRYDAANKVWERLLGTALISGQGNPNGATYNPYPVGPILGPDGYWHVVWVWRDTPDAATNHDLSYVRSRDLIRWETAGGAPLALPLRIGTSGIIVDPVPPGGGMINNNTKIGFDSQNRVIVVYHKYDGTGATQLFNARFENGAWVRHQTTRWGYRWNFGGGGTLVFPIEVEGVKALRDGTLTQRYYHAHEINLAGQAGWGAYRLNPDTLAAEELIEPPLPYPRALDPAESTTPGMASRWAADTGRGPDPDIYFMARWETLDSNRDQPREVVPPPTQLRVYAFRYSAMSNGL